MLTFDDPRAGDGTLISDLMSGWIDETPWMPFVHTAREMHGFGPWLCDVADVTVLRAGSDFAGFFAFQDEKLQAFFVTADRRGQGVGAQAMARMKSQKSHIALWTFQQNTGAQRFYERHGFVETDRTDGARNDEKIPDIKYEWSVPA